MRILRIFDVSTFIYAGSVNKYSFLTPELIEDADGFKERRIMTGGVSLLWNILYYEYGKCDLAFCCDRWPSIKQGMNEFYKGNREHKDGISKCKHVCEYILNDCGLTLLYEDGYEADDFIYSLVRDKKSQYDHIYIYTADSDLYFLVDDNVSILPASSRAKTVTRQNYTYTVGGKDSYVPYNALTFYKIISGDKSDNIDRLSPEMAGRIRSVIDNETYYPIMGDKEALTQTLSMFGDVVRAQCELVFPLDVQTPSIFGAGDKLRIAEWGNAIKNKMWKNGNALPTHIKESIKELADLGYYTED